MFIIRKVWFATLKSTLSNSGAEAGSGRTNSNERAGPQDMLFNSFGGLR